MAQEVTTLKGIEQGRASYAFKVVQEVSDSLKKEYKSAAKKLPVQIKMNGLGQSLAFLKSKGEKDEEKPKNAYDQLYEDIGIWLQTEDVKRLVEKDEELVKEVIQLESHAYRKATVETLALLNWMRRFVDGLIEN
ncbi:MAG: type III-B CRISPR module-associated protein Cmr5 [Candidatus Poribacteria bacterium]|nr:type III-B CRISPR module-associated protein Cmr5 [Candidatus Poribacteria bacterium]